MTTTQTRQSLRSLLTQFTSCNLLTVLDGSDGLTAEVASELLAERDVDVEWLRQFS